MWILKIRFYGPISGTKFCSQKELKIFEFYQLGKFVNKGSIEIFDGKDI